MDTNETLEQPIPAESLAVEAPEEHFEPARPITSRFLFVDVAALRAKQLRRGAQLRFEFDHGVAPIRKPERMAMEEVRRGLVQYQVPPQNAARTEANA